MLHFSATSFVFPTGHAATEGDIQESWDHVYHLHFLKRAEETAHKCQRGFVLRQHSPEVPTLFLISVFIDHICVYKSIGMGLEMDHMITYELFSGITA